MRARQGDGWKIAKISIQKDIPFAMYFIQIICALPHLAYCFELL